MKKVIKKLFLTLISIIPGRDRAIHWLSDKKTFRTLLLLSKEGYFTSTGWTSSISADRPLSSDQNPIPWFTYPCIHFIQENIKPNMNVLEIGAGWSTLFFGKHANHVLSFEDNAEWFHSLSKMIPMNVNLILYNSNSQIATTIKETNKNFDLVIFDGSDDRIRTSNIVLEQIDKKAIIILDDSERKEYSPLIEKLTNEGYKKINFWGLAPIIHYEKCTTLFYNKENPFNI